MAGMLSASEPRRGQLRSRPADAACDTELRASVTKVELLDERILM